jgi:hypothetical protein
MKMTKKEALIKSLIWRFGVSIPVSFLLNLIFLKEINASVALTVAGALAGIILYYLFDLLWFNFLGDALGFDRATEEDSAGSRDDLKNQPT